MKRTKLTFQGKTQGVSAWSKEMGIPEKLILSRHERGWSDEAVLTYPVKKQQGKRWEWQGEMYTAAQLAKIHGDISATSMRERLEKMSVKEALETPRNKKGKKRKPKEEKKNEEEKVIPEVRIRKKVDLKQCRTCQYRGNLGNSIGSGVFCAYSLITERCRMLISEPSPRCTVYVKGKSLLRSTTMKKMGRGMW